MIRLGQITFNIVEAYNIANTGDGVLSAITANSSGPTQVWTLTCTADAIDGGTFSVVGSISGATADLTVGTPYDNTMVSLTLGDGAVDWVIGDIVTVTITNTEVMMPVDKDFSTIQVGFTSTVTALEFSINGALSGDNRYPVYTHIVTAGELAAGGYIASIADNIPLSSVEAKLTSLTVNGDAVVDIYGV